MKVRAVLFDLDGTVVENAYDWPRIREALGAGTEPILSWLDGLAEPERSRKRELLEEYEAEQTERSLLREGMREFLEDLALRGVRTALITNNSLRNAVFLTRKFSIRFDQLLTRESGLWKPSGAPFLEAARRMGIAPGDCCVVGDTRFDVLAARAAGVPHVFLLGNGNASDPEAPGPWVEIVPTVERLRERLESLL